MATIPSVARLDRAVPQGRTGVVSTFDNSTGETLAALSRDVDQYQRQLEIEREEQFTNAALEFGIDMERAQRDFARDPDYSTHVERFETGATKRLGELAANLKDPEDRANFVRRGQLRIEQAKTGIAANAFQLERSDMRGQIDGQLEQSRNAAVRSDSIAVGDFSAVVRGRLDAAVRKGYYSAEEADQLYRNWQGSVAEGLVQMAPVEQRGELLGNPYVVEHMAPERLKALREESSKALVVDKAVATVDALLDQPDITLAKGYEAIGKIKDTDVRLAAEPRFEYRYKQQKLAEQEWANDALLRIQEHIQTTPGAQIETLPPELAADYRKLSLTDRNSLQQLTIRGFAKATSPATKEWLISLAHTSGNWEEKRRMLTASAHLMSEQDYEQYATLFANKMTPSEPDISAEVSRAFPREKDAEKRRQILPLLEENMAAYRERTGSDMDTTRLRQEIYLLSQETKNRWFDKPLYQLGYEDADEREAETRRVYLEEIAGTDLTAARATRQFLIASGRNPDTMNRFEIERVFRVEQQIDALRRYFNQLDIPTANDPVADADAVWARQKAADPTLPVEHHLKLMRAAVGLAQ